MPLPRGAALDEDSGKKLLTGLIRTVFAASEVGFGWDEAAFDGSLEDGCPIPLEVGLCVLEVGDGFVEAGELLFDLRDDAALLP